MAEFGGSASEEKNRRISRILTIDEIINPSVRRSVPVARPEIRVSEHGGRGNPSRSNGSNNEFLRSDQNQVIYQKPNNASPLPANGSHAEITIRDGPPRVHQPRKNVSFASTTTTPSVRVYREQYWNWSCTCRDWSRREKKLVVAVGILACIILTLVAIISVYARDHKFRPNLSDGWLGWTF